MVIVPRSVNFKLIIRSTCQFFLLMFGLNLTHSLLEINPFGVMLYDNMKGLQLSFLLGDHHSKEENKEVQSKMTRLIQQKNDVVCSTTMNE